MPKTVAKNFFPGLPDYNDFLDDIKKNILRARNKAIISVNIELLGLYFSIGRDIVLRQKKSNWGDDFIGQIEKDIKRDLPNIKGFSRTNLFYMKKFYIFFNEQQKIPQPVGQIPWGHIRLILDKISNKPEANFYIQKIIENSWSRIILDHQISLDLYHRQGKILSNFEKTIPKKQAKLVQENFKKDYILDFLDLSEKDKERDLEKKLIQNISDFLMEMGTGFAFIGKQHKILVGQKEFFIDLLFYNYILKSFVVIELKTTEFKPSHLGQLGFYTTAIDNDIKTESDGKTLGLLICKTQNRTVVEYALSTINSPTGVAEYKFLSELPSKLEKLLPTQEDFKQILQ